jgi:hypothetical protein
LNFINTSIIVLTASLALLTLHAEDNSVPLSRLPIPLELMPPDIGESDSPSTPSEALSSVPITATNSPAPALEDRERAELSLERQEIVSAREQLR